MTAPQLRDLSLTEFALRLSEKTPTPGGGSVAAHLASLGAALGGMAFRFTSGPKYAAVEGALAARADALETIRTRAAELVDADAASYERVMAGYRLPKATESEKAARSAAIQAGLAAAIEVPAETLELAARALELITGGAADLNPNVASDCASGGWCLRGAAEAAFLNVKINAASLADKAAAGAWLADCESRLGKVRAAAEALNDAIARKLS